MSHVIRKTVFSSMKSSENNNSADQSTHLQSLKPTTAVKISQRIGKVVCIGCIGWCRSVCSSAKSGANNDAADQPAHSCRHKATVLI